ncbi:hypothetical protein GGI25_003175 [Coemansia spiralis]|uniref:NADH dehydrogenase [ubiquinone] 1 beta subcomplex subunit 2 n=2 Tax=Coemansia TaxID=4863 RepID=A0A9W8G2E8_9FUNG|nr:hypothetical protein BX070DRAFT_192382 [Coemansia spiralis]KAJ1991814.1 hypothetical protein EDC05_003169 [Coemansia umbellata]KAJ2621865.1 hypothetical protein GGI26_003708 [Coemansia sp. RSA 1358]KAJ2677420.1 hypothetical protein GGI25_003175 [Coemansia spiralis]
MPAKSFGGFVPPKAPLRYRVLSKGLGASMWFWMMYRMKEDGAVVFGLRHPWDHGDHSAHNEHSDHGHSDKH